MECKDSKLLQAAIDFQNSPQDPEINDIKDFFIAGAQWMASQGVTSTGEINQTSGENTIIELDEWIDLEDCDKVTVQIRTDLKH